jgi:hypothetical protein
MTILNDIPYKNLFLLLLFIKLTFLFYNFIPLKIRISDYWSGKYYKKSKFFVPLCSDGGTDHFPAFLLLYFFNLEALVLVLPLFAPSRCPINVPPRNISPCTPPIKPTAKQRQVEKACVMRSRGTPKDFRKHLYSTNIIL